MSWIKTPIPKPTPVLAEALVVAAPLVEWLVRSGVGYAEFAAALKPVFLAKAQQDLEQSGEKLTDSAVSLRSGLHRKDVRTFRESADESLRTAKANGTAWTKPTASNQVVTRWLSDPDYPDCIALTGETISFDALARSVSKDLHPRAVLQDLVRLGVVTEHEGQVSLLRQAFAPDAKHVESRRLMAGSVADHLQAGVQNLSKNPNASF